MTMTKQWMQEVFEESFDQAEAFETFRQRNVPPERVTQFFGPDMGREFEFGCKWAEGA